MKSSYSSVVFFSLLGLGLAAPHQNRTCACLPNGLAADLLEAQAAVPAEWTTFWSDVPESQQRAALDAISASYETEDEAEEAFNRAAPRIALKLDEIEEFVIIEFLKMNEENKLYLTQAMDLAGEAKTTFLASGGRPISEEIKRKITAHLSAASSLSPSAMAQLRAAFPRLFTFLEDPRVQKADFGPTFTTANAGAQACEQAVSVACDPISASIKSVRRGVEMPTQWSEQSISPPSLIVPAPPLVTRDDDDDSISDAPSLPYDSESPPNRERRRSSGLDGFMSVASSFEEANNNTRKSRVAQLIEQEAQTSRKEAVRKLERSFGTEGSLSLLTSASATLKKKSITGDSCAQTDIAQFQIDEILLRLHSIQQATKPTVADKRTTSMMERSVETTASILDMMFGEKNDAGTQYDRAAETALMDQSVLTDVLQVLQATAAVQCGAAGSERRHIGTEPFTMSTSDCTNTTDSPDRDNSPIVTNEAVTQSYIDSRDVASSPINRTVSASRAIGTTPPPERMVVCTQTSLEEKDLDPPPPKRKPTIVCEAEVGTNIAYAMMCGVDESTQMTPPSPRRSHTHNFSPPLGRSDSLQSLCGSIGQPHVECQEVVVQTDDSYLKIARRLDQYRSNKTQFLPVCAAEPLSPNSAAAAATSSAERSQRNYYVDPSARRKSSRAFSFRKKKEAWNHASAQTSMDPDRLAAALDGEVERARSSSPSSCDDHLLFVDERTRKAALKRKASLPAGIPRGRVAEFVQAHEKGNPNPGVEAENLRRAVTIIRQHSLGVGGD